MLVRLKHSLLSDNFTTTFTKWNYGLWYLRTDDATLKSNINISSHKNRPLTDMRPPFCCQRNSFWRALQRVSSYFQFTQTIVSVIITTGTGNLHELYSFFQTSKYLIYVAIRINERTYGSKYIKHKPNPVFYIVHQHSTRKITNG